MKKYWPWLLLLSFLFSCRQERFSRVDGQNYRIKTLGRGAVTVVFENGMSDSLEVWGAIPDSVARFARVFLYDRADIAKSDSSKQARTVPNMVNELRAILKKENIQPPYVLAGHSLGGLTTRYFASEYADEVRGLLLLDPSPEAFWDAMPEEDLKEYIEGGNEWYRSKFAPRYRKEWYAFIPNLAYMKNLHINEDLPVILVSASAWEWFKYQSPMLDGLKNARQIELEGQHHIFKDHPGLIVKYLRELVDAAAR